MSTPTCGELSCDECDARTTALTAEIAHLRAEVERLKKQIKDDNRSYGCELRDPNGTIWEQAAKDHARAERAEAEVKRLGHLEAVLRSCAFDKDGTAWKTVCGWWSKKYDAVERQMSENATRAERAEAELAAMKEDTK